MPLHRVPMERDGSALQARIDELELAGEHVTHILNAPEEWLIYTTPRLTEFKTRGAVRLP